MSMVQSELLRQLHEMSATQAQHTRIAEQQATLLEAQERTMQDLMEEFETLFNVIRGSADGITPSLHETLRKIEGRLTLTESDLNARIQALHDTVRDLRLLAQKIEKGRLALDVRVKDLERVDGDRSTKSKNIRGFFYSVALVVLGFALPKAIEWLLTVI